MPKRRSTTTAASRARAKASAPRTITVDAHESLMAEKDRKCLEHVQAELLAVRQTISGILQRASHEANASANERTFLTSGRYKAIATKLDQVAAEIDSVFNQRKR